ncbi:hypothetical protein FJNA_24470 [Thermus sp. FJN-A]
MEATPNPQVYDLNHKGRPTAKPTLPWVFQLMWVRLVELGRR